MQPFLECHRNKEQHTDKSDKSWITLCCQGVRCVCVHSNIIAFGFCAYKNGWTKIKLYCDPYCWINIKLIAIIQYVWVKRSSGIIYEENSMNERCTFNQITMCCVLLRLFAKQQQQAKEPWSSQPIQQKGFNLQYELWNFECTFMNNERVNRMKDFPFYKLLNVIIVIQFIFSHMNNSTVDKIVRCCFFIHE